MADFYEESRRPARRAPRGGPRRRAAGRGRPAVLRLLHVHARPAAPTASTPRSCRACRRSRPPPAAVAQPAGAADRRAHRAARHPARARARPPPGRHRRRDHHEARPHVPRRASRARGRPAGSSDALYVERASMADQRWLPVADVDPATVPYFSLIVVPGDSLARTRSRYEPSRGDGGADAADRRRPSCSSSGSGPARDDWLTPEVAAALAEVDHVVGYAPYVNRVPQRAGLQPARVRQHRRGRPGPARPRPRAGRRAGRGGVRRRRRGLRDGGGGVRGGRGRRRTPTCPIRVLPGVSAVQAVAARAGAPIGGDFAVMSLSDRLKPWSVIERRLRAIARGRPGAGGLQPGVAVADHPGRRHAARSCSSTGSRHRRRRRPRRRPGRGEPDGHDARPSSTPRAIDMKCLLIVGATGTTVTPTGRVWTRRSVRD